MRSIRSRNAINRLRFHYEISRNQYHSISITYQIATRPSIQSILIHNHIRQFSSNTKKTDNKNKVIGDEELEADEDRPIDKTSNTSSFDPPPQPPKGAVGILRSSISFIAENITQGYSELMGYSKPNSLKKQVSQAITYRKPKPSEEGEEEEERYEGPTALVAVKEALNPWDAMKARLADSPLIREILKNTKKVGKIAGETEIGKKVKEANDHVQDKMEDIREIWETSQNPIIYTMSGIWENVTGESEEAIATSAIRRLDPDFAKETWAEEVRHQLAAPVIKAHLVGSIRKWKEWLGEAVYEKLSADIRARKTDGYTFDPNILAIDDNMIVMKVLDNGTPVVVVVYMVQQINCIRNKDGEIIEGGESDLRAKFYSLAFQQDYNEDTGVVMWKIVDYEFAGDVPYVF